MYDFMKCVKCYILQVRQILVRVRVQNESVQLGGRTEHGYSGKPARRPAEQVAAVRVHACASGHRRRLWTPSTTRISDVSWFVGGCASPSPTPATTATALRQRARRRRSVPSFGRRHHRQQTPRRGTR